MATRLLVLKNLRAVPHRDFVDATITRHLKPLVDSGDLEIDRTGTRKAEPSYVLEFEEKYDWSPHSRRAARYMPLYYGMTGEVNLEAIRRTNQCTNVCRHDTCERLFRNTTDELGMMVATTALHEIGHLFGLMDDKAFTGADPDGHSSDPENMMFSITRHKDYLPVTKDAGRTMRYRIRRGDTLSGIALRIGFWPASTVGWKQLFELRGKDGRRNGDILKSRNPHRIFPDEEIWIPDVLLRLAFHRENEVKPKAFTKAQYDTMRAALRAGKTIF